MSWLCKVAGHSFSPRYDEGEPSRFGEVSGISPWHMVKLIESTKAKTYRCDVCTRCGMVVNRQEGK